MVESLTSPNMPAEEVSYLHCQIEVCVDLDLMQKCKIMMTIKVTIITNLQMAVHVLNASEKRPQTQPLC